MQVLHKIKFLLNTRLTKRLILPFVNIFKEKWKFKELKKGRVVVLKLFLYFGWSFLRESFCQRCNCSCTISTKDRVLIYTLVRIKIQLHMCFFVLKMVTGWEDDGEGDDEGWQQSGRGGKTRNSRWAYLRETSQTPNVDMRPFSRSGSHLGGFVVYSSPLLWTMYNTPKQFSAIDTV